MIQLRPYQQRGVTDIRAAYARGHRRVLYVLPTGGGKTQLAAFVLRALVNRGNRGLFAAGRTELIDQTVAKLREAGLDDIRIIQAERDEGNPDAPVIVGSVQTLAAPRWEGRIPTVKLIVLDEAHHAPSDQYGSIARAQPAAMLLGLTATPERLDGKPMGREFDVLVPGPSVGELTDLGHLAPCRVWAGPPDLRSGELAMTPLEAYQRFAPGLRAAVFCRDRAHAAAELASFRAAGVPSDIVTGNMSGVRRRAVLSAWRAGDLHVVTSVGVLTEGFDLPALGVAILARRFSHAGLYLQVAGRILRPHPSKPHALLIDLAGSAHLHGPPDLDRIYSLDGKPITTAVRDSFSQCRTCGAMFRSGPSRCAHCGAELPVRELALPRSTGAGVTELQPARARRREFVVRMTRKRRGVCAACGGGIEPGDDVLWATLARTARHVVCPSALQVHA